ncbi:MAG: acyclic terpene utilization AtuA family protein [Phreatobacter sp.]
MKTIRIGAGAGYSGDRIEPAVELAEKGDLDVLVFECLAERTIALAQQARSLDPDAGYDPLLADRLRAVLPACAARGTTVITNMGAAHPAAAARKAVAVARQLGLSGLKVAAVTGDDVMALVRHADLPFIDRAGRTSDLADRLISANAYLGAGPIVQGLAGGADIVIAGRISDPAMFLAPLIHRFGWADNDWARLGKGTLIGHLLECAGQVTGGYFADPGRKDVAGLARLGFPLAEVGEDGDAVITKVAGSGGQVTLQTCKEQLLYEVHDPARYLQPDVVADFTGVRLQAAGADRVAVQGGDGTARTGQLKVSVGYRDGFIGEGQISYAGAGAFERAALARGIAEQRLELTGLAAEEWRLDLIGVDAVHRGAAMGNRRNDAEVRLRVAGRVASHADAVRIGNEVETLYTNGPAGGGGVSKAVREVIAIASVLIPEDSVRPQIEWHVA